MTKIDKLIREREHDYFVFKPNREFYKQIGLNQKRWAQLRRGEIDPTLRELTSVAEFFKVEVKDLI